jgi:hypothetical protein
MRRNPCKSARAVFCISYLALIEITFKKAHVEPAYASSIFACLKTEIFYRAPQACESGY